MITIPMQFLPAILDSLAKFLVIISIPILILYIFRRQKFFRWLRWKLIGSPLISYPGKHCGCCGAWIDVPFTIRTYQSFDKYWDTWDLCDTCKNKKGKLK